jgi:hypothetical protein
MAKRISYYRILKPNAVILTILSIILLVSGVFFLKQADHVDSSCQFDDVNLVKLCWQQIVESSIKQGDIAGAFDSLTRLYDAAPAMGETCHSLTHEIGRAAYRLFARDVEFDITPQTAYCSYGFYHGFMEELVIAQPDMRVARDFCSYVDARLSSITPDVTLQCYHGIGHGTVNNHDPRTWGNAQALIDPALLLCEQVASTDDELSRCATGVFNGLSIFYSTGEYNLTFDTSDPVAICRAQKKQYQDPCYISMNMLLLQLANYDLRRAIGYIDAIPEDSIAQHTVINLASPVGTRNMDAADHMPIVQTCRSLQPRLHLACIQGYAFGFMEQGKPEQEYIKPIAFCQSKYLDIEEQNACFEYIFSYLPQWYGAEKVQKICSMLDGDVQRKCYENN